MQSLLAPYGRKARVFLTWANRVGGIPNPLKVLSILPGLVLTTSLSRPILGALEPKGDESQGMQPFPAFLLGRDLATTNPITRLSEEKPTVMVHYMPWFAADPEKQKWGWHWTMNKFEPAKGQIASHYHPLRGPYDSSNPEVIDSQLQQMKAAGINGVMIDWYGLGNLWDYPQIHRNTQLLIKRVEKAHMKFAIVFEDATVGKLIENKVILASDAVSRTKAAIAWVGKNWFTSQAYLRLDNRPVFLVFGPQYFKSNEWSEIFPDTSPKPLFFSESHRAPNAEGAFNWPIPQQGPEGSWRAVEDFERESQSWPNRIPVIYPRFHDFYSEAKVGPSWGNIPDDDGKTLQKTLDIALANHPRIIQFATWNDWGEGTQIEPSVEFGYRDLEAIQRRLKPNKPNGQPYKPSDLRPPYSASSRGTYSK
jgi:Glycosyl hydrolase family 99